MKTINDINNMNNEVNKETCWDCIKPNTFPLKGKDGIIGYGCRKKRGHLTGREGCGMGKRNSYRDYKKYGFDTTECWSLDHAIMCWLSDNVGGFFRRCGSMEDWSEWDLEGNHFKTLEAEITSIDDFIKAFELRNNSFLAHLEDFLNNGDRDKFLQFILFIIPRLRYFINHTYGYPRDMKNINEWKSVLEEMIDKFKEGSYSKYFVSNFFSLWY